MLTLFADRDFRNIWIVGLAVFVVRWLETLAVGVFAYAATGSAFVVAMLTMLRLLPMGLFGAVLGAVAERMDRRRALLLVVLSQVATSAVIAALAFADAVEVWHLAVASFMNGIAWASDNPVRRAMIGQVAGPARIGVAMSIDVGTSNASRVLGPTLGGVLLAAVGLEGAFLLSVVIYLPAVFAALQPAAPGHRLGPRRVALGAGAHRRGLRRSCASEPRLVGTLLVTLLFNLFGWPFTSMIPVIGQDRLGLGPGGIGVLAGMDGVGALSRRDRSSRCGAAGAVPRDLPRRHRAVLCDAGRLRTGTDAGAGGRWRWCWPAWAVPASPSCSRRWCSW